MLNPPAGATPEEWTHWSCDLAGLGLLQDLVPNVCDAEAEWSERSTVRAAGKLPSEINARGKARGLAGWTERTTTRAEVDRWSQDSRLGFGVIGREARPLDIDVDDPAAANAIADRIDEFLGAPLPRRGRAGSGRLLLLVFVPRSETVRRVAFPVAGGMIELLGNKQQAVVAGCHPSGARYAWLEGQPQRVEITPEQYEGLRAMLDAEFRTGEAIHEAARERGVDVEADDAVADYLIANGMTLGASADGRKLFIECPKRDLHTRDGDPTQTAWLVAGSGGFERGHVDCRHTSHGKITDAEFIEHIGFADQQRAEINDEFDVIEDCVGTPPSVPRIVISDGELHVAATAGEQALIAAGVPFYVRAGAIVRPVVETASAAHGQRTSTVRLTAVGDDMMIDHLSRHARWEKHDARRRGLAPTNPPAQVARIILTRDGEWKLPELAGAITTPTLRSDGSVLSSPGHDPQTRLLLVSPPTLPALSEKPDRGEAEAALSLLDGLLDGFPFVGDASRSVALSALISPVVRGALPVVPLHAFSAPAPGTGKSYLVDLVAAIQTGERAPVITAGRTEEETEKRLASALIAGQPIVSIDNVNGDIGGDLLCQAVERPLLNVRPLGSSKLVRIHNTACLFATGNNVRLVDDMTRRVLLCSLDANQERPELRQFSSEPFLDVLRDRGRYIAAALIIVRAYLGDGQPSTLPRVASFGEWSDLVRSALVWLGRADPVETMEKARADDPAGAQLSALLPAWNELLGDGALTLKDVRAKLDAELMSASPTVEALRDALSSLAPCRHGSDFDARRAGLALGRYEGRIVGGLKLIKRYDAHSKQQTWAVRNVQFAGSAG